MLSTLWNRLPLTISLWVIVGSYSLVRFAIRKITDSYWRRKIPTRSASFLILPQDIQNEILKHLMERATDKELLDVSATSKYFYDRISNSPDWLRDRLEDAHDAIKHGGTGERLDLGQPGPWHRKYETDLLGADKVFSPKLAHFFIINERSRVPST